MSAYAVGDERGARLLLRMRGGFRASSRVGDCHDYILVCYAEWFTLLYLYCAYRASRV